MVVQQILNALPVLQKLIELKLPVRKAYEIYKLARQFNDIRDFSIMEEKKMIEKYEAEISQDGRIYFKTPESQNQFFEEHNSLMIGEIDSFPIIELKLDELNDIVLSPMEIGLLSGIIDFKD